MFYSDRHLQGGQERHPLSRFLPAGTIRGIARGAHAAIDGKLIERLPKLEIISNFGVGYDGIDLRACAARGIVVTNTPDVHEHYPQISPDGKKLCFSVDTGERRDTVRSLWVMDIDGKNRKKIADNAREPFWSPDANVLGYLPQEFPKFNVMDYYTKGLNFCELATGRIEPHVNSTNLYHLYNPGFSTNGKWIVATVHAGMGFDHAILLIEAKRYRTQEQNRNDSLFRLTALIQKALEIFKGRIVDVRA